MFFALIRRRGSFCSRDRRTFCASIERERDVTLALFDCSFTLTATAAALAAAAEIDLLLLKEVAYEEDEEEDEEDALSLDPKGSEGNTKLS